MLIYILSIGIVHLLFYRFNYKSIRIEYLRKLILGSYNFLYYRNSQIFSYFFDNLLTKNEKRILLDKNRIWEMYARLQSARLRSARLRSYWKEKEL